MVPDRRVLASLLLLSACEGADPPGDASDDTEAPADTEEAFVPAACGDADATLRVTHAQAIGSHNSTHLQPALPVHPSHRYSHAPLDVQLAEQGVRAVELDLHLRVDGVFEVFHLPGIDEETTCRLLSDCLGTMLAWSRANPCHLPLMVWLEPKDEDLDVAFPDQYALFADRHEELEAAIVATWPRARIFTPDELRGSHATLSDAVRADGWPTLDRLRGRVIFSMLDSSTHRAAYLAPSDVLAGRLLFVDASSADEPFAATLKIDNAVGDGDLVRSVVGEGFLVTSNVDGADNPVEENEAKLAASLAAGSHYLASDFPGAREGYSAVVPGGRPAGCNPISAPKGCTAADIEALPAPP